MNIDDTMKYKKKYFHFKRIAKTLIIENAALCDEVARIQESILIVKDERKFLLRKILEYDKESEAVQNQHKHFQNNSTQQNGPSTKGKKYNRTTDTR